MSEQINPFISSPERKKYTKEEIAQQLDTFTERYHLKSLRDRLRVGLNEAAILAFEQTNQKVKELCRKIAETDEEARMIYENLVDMSVDIQQHGPWDYARDLGDAKSPEVKLWYMLNTVESLGYEKEMDLNDQEFFEDLQRINGLLDRALADPDTFFQESKEHILERSKAAIYFDKDDKEHKIPYGEGLQTALPMAIQGYEVGIAHDSEGWVFVMARGMISDSLLESCGLTKQVKADPRDPNRRVTVFLNEDGQEVVKKVHRGFLVILSKSFKLAHAIAEAIQDRQSMLTISDEDLGHTRVIQTSEKERSPDEEADFEHWQRKQFLRRPENRNVHEKDRETTALTRPRQDFYDQMHYIRGMYVYLDKLEKERRKLAAHHKELTDADREAISENVWDKMQQKVDELRYVNGILEDVKDWIPPDVHSVIDMAGGAGDLGLAVGTELLAQGRELEDVEIVDPQPGVDDFMYNLIDHIPFRDDFEKIAHHNTGYLQDAHIRPDSIVVAKHACGTLTDDIIKQWIHSESPMLVAMTCCQGKAKDMPASYGLSQEEWHNTCSESDLTNTEIPDEPGKAREIALRKLEQGNKAMHTLDMARVEYLRRHGFKAELRTTDKFPKGDVIIARRLPKNFMQRLEEFQQLEKDDPLAYDALLMKLDRMAAGHDPGGERQELFGEKWIDDDFTELIDRLSPARTARERAMREQRRHAATERYEAKKEEERQKREAELAAAEKKAAKERQEARMRDIFPESQGKPNIYLQQRSKVTGKPVPGKQIGRIMGEIQKIIKSNENAEAIEVRKIIDAKLEEMGF